VLLVVRPPDHLAHRRPVLQLELQRVGQARQAGQRGQAGQGHVRQVDIGQGDIGQVDIGQGDVRRQLEDGQGDAGVLKGVLDAAVDAHHDGLDVGDGERVLLELLEGGLDGGHDGVDGVLDDVFDGRLGGT